MQINLDTYYKPFERDRNGKPHPQYLFHASPAKYRLYVGGMGSGKTRAGCAEAIKQALEQPGTLGLIGRQTYGSLTDTTMRVFFEILPPQLIAKWNKNENHLYLRNGSEIIFRALEPGEGWQKLQSLEVAWFYIDEASETPEEVYLILKGRLRQGKAKRLLAWLTSNPNGRDWLWKHFVARQREDHSYFHATTLDNPTLPKDYVGDLLATYPEAWVQRFIFGEFNTFEGQVFPEFEESVHLIDDIDPRTFDPDHSLSWEIVRAIDHGRTNPTACLWGAFDGDGTGYIYREYYKSNDIVSSHAQAINALSEGERVSYTIIDPSAKARGPTNNRSVIDEYADFKIYAQPGNNDVMAGINRVSEYLKFERGQKGEVVKPPRLYICRRCFNLVRELGQYRWQQLRPGQELNEPEKPVKHDDHTVDALRYMLMTRPSALKLRAVSQFQRQAASITPLRTTPWALQSEKRHVLAWPNF